MNVTFATAALKGRTPTAALKGGRYALNSPL